MPSAHIGVPTIIIIITVVVGVRKTTDTYMSVCIFICA